MENRATPPTIPTAPAPAPAPEARPPHEVARNLQGVSDAIDQASGATVKAAQAPQAVQTHVELAFDKAINRVVGRVVNDVTGETILDIPPEQLKALYLKMREHLGSLVDGIA